MARRPSISVILPTYNRCDVVERTLDHLAAQDYPADRIEILVCDNSSDGTPEMVNGSRPGGANRATGVERRAPAGGQAQPGPAPGPGRARPVHERRRVAGARCLGRARRHPPGPRRAGGGAGPRRAVGPDAIHRRSSSGTDPSPTTRSLSVHDQPVPARFFWSMNLSLPRQVMLDRQLVFHEDWANIGHEDVELGYRWNQAGYPLIYRADAWGEHFHPHDLDSACRLQYSVGRGLRDLEVLIPDAGSARALRRLPLRQQPAFGRPGPGPQGPVQPLDRPAAAGSAGSPRPPQPAGRVELLEDPAAPHRPGLPGAGSAPSAAGAHPARPAGTDEQPARAAERGMTMTQVPVDAPGGGEGDGGATPRHRRPEWPVIAVTLGLVALAALALGQVGSKALYVLAGGRRRWSSSSGRSATCIGPPLAEATARDPPASPPPARSRWDRSAPRSERWWPPWPPAAWPSWWPTPAARSCTG